LDTLVEVDTDIAGHAPGKETDAGVVLGAILHEPT
jgi:hypothetical protein